MRRLMELLKTLEGNSMVEWKKLGDFLDFEQPTRYLVKSTDYDDSYGIPVLTAGQSLLLGYTNETDGVFKASKDNPTIIFDDFTTSFHWIDYCFKVKSSAMKMLKPKAGVNFRYVYYAMCGIHFVPTQHQRHWISKYSQFEIPVPSLSEQIRIVGILDTFTASIENLKQQIAQRRKQYEHYRDQLLDLEGKEGVEEKRIGDISFISDYVSNGSFASLRENVQYKIEPDYAILVRVADYSSGFDKSKFVYIDEHAYDFLSKSALYGGEIIMSNVGSCGLLFRCPKLDRKMSLAPNAILIKSDHIDYLYYWLGSNKGQEEIKKITSKSAMPKFNKTEFKKITIPIPSTSEQSRIVSILDTFEASITNLEQQLAQRERQYEYYRNKLLDFE